MLTWQSRVLEVFVLETMCNFAKPCPTSGRENLRSFVLKDLRGPFPGG